MPYPSVGVSSASPMAHTLTALTVLSSGVIGVEGAQFAFGHDGLGSEVSIAAFSTVFGGGVAGVIIAIGITLFALSTILSWSLYGMRCFEFLFGAKRLRVYQVMFICFVVIGATMRLSLAWKIADTLNGLMAIPNLIALLALSGVVFRLTREHFGKGRK